MSKKRKPSTSKAAACREHSCPNGRGANGYCTQHQIEPYRHHDKKARTVGEAVGDAIRKAMPSALRREDE